MAYENRLPPEGINTSDEHPLKEFIILVLGVGATVLALVLVLSIFAGWLVRFIPFETERHLAEKFLSASEIIPLKSDAEQQPDTAQQSTLDYLQDLANKLAVAQGLPDDFEIIVHYVEDKNVNAFATLGGHVVMFSGLLEKLPHENALAMVLAHEIAHIKHRDPIVASGRGLTVGLAIASLMGIGNSSVVDTMVSQVASATILKYSRDQEQAADITAMESLDRYYGHLSGAEVLFEVLLAHDDSHVLTSFLSTHPLTEQRIEGIKNYRAAHSGVGEVTELPDFMASNN